MKNHILLLITALSLVHIGYGQGQKETDAPIDREDIFIIDTGNGKPIFASHIIFWPHDDIASDRWLRPEEVSKYDVKNNHYRLMLLKPGLE